MSFWLLLCVSSMSEEKTHTFCSWLTLQVVCGEKLVHEVLQAAAEFPGTEGTMYSHCPQEEQDGLHWRGPALHQINKILIFLFHELLQN